MIRPDVESFVFIRIYVLILQISRRFVKRFGANSGQASFFSLWLFKALVYHRANRLKLRQQEEVLTAYGHLIRPKQPFWLFILYVPGDVWELYAEPLLDGLNLLSETQDVTRVSLAGDHLRVIVEAGLGEKDIQRMLAKSNLRVTSIQKGEPTLEDVFLNLAKG